MRLRIVAAVSVMVANLAACSDEATVPASKTPTTADATESDAALADAAADDAASDVGAANDTAAADAAQVNDAAVGEDGLDDGTGADAGPTACAVDADCPGAPGACQAWACMGGACAAVNLADGSTCSDGNACTTGDACATGACLGAAAKDCNDSNGCTSDSCTAATGDCIHTPSAAFCDDGNPCTEGDVCKDNACAAGAAKTCDDGNGCTSDSCDAKDGSCVHLPNAATCDDGDACTGSGTCTDGTCAPGTPVACDDGNPCTDNGCDKLKGCTYANNAAPCSDASKCVLGTCGGGACSVGTKTGCDDNNPCTTDTCDGAKGCVFAPANDGIICGKGDACAAAAVCAAGVCVPGKATDCNDGKACTDDACDPATGCKWTPNTGACDDGNPCTGPDVCSVGKCVAGPAVDPKKACDDGNACTDDSCDPSQGCLHAANTAACNDGNPCTAGEQCAGGACKPGPLAPCDDGKACTVDNCDPKSGDCTWAPKPGACDDGNACTVGDVCTGGQCTPGPKSDCNDNEACTTDSCDGKGGCVHSVVAGGDAQVCDGTTANGACWKATKATLTWLKAEEACMAWGGHLARIDSAADNTTVRNVANNSCGDGSAPWIGLTDQAVEGQFVWADGTPMSYSNWNGGEPNNSKLGCANPDPGEDYAQMVPGGGWNDLCNTWQVGCYVCRRPLPVVACADPSKCLGGGICTAGKCTGTKTTCDDGNACTNDTCDAAKGCVYQNATDGSACGAGFVCTAGVCTVGSPSNPAKSCAELVGTGAKDGVYTLDPDGKAGVEPAFQTWCDMTSDGGGWTLVLKVNGDKKTFVYDAALWTNKTAYAPTATAMDANETKLASFWTVPFKDVRVGLATGNTASQWLKIPYVASSLYEVFADGKYKAWTPPLGRPVWKALVPGSSLEPNCNREGFNNFVVANAASARIGILGNNENDCVSPDSRLGIGTGGNYCGISADIAAGNSAGCGGDNGDKNIKSFGYVFVR